MALGLVSMRLGRNAGGTEEHETLALVAVTPAVGETDAGLGLWAAYGRFDVDADRMRVLRRAVSADRGDGLRVAEPDTQPDVRLQPARLPVPTITVERRSSGVDWRSLIQQYDGWNVETMMRIIYGPYPCPNGESGGNPNAVSPDGQNIGGLQINLVHGYTRQQLLDPATNVAVGHDVWLSQGYSAWSCY